MAYYLNPKNKDAGGFHFGAFSFLHLLEACGYLWPCVVKGGKWYCVWGADPRMPEGDNYPRLISNDGFAVTDEEARVLARVARNWTAVQRSLPEDHRIKDDFGRPEERLPWPQKIRDDWPVLFESFADWADKSGGFEVH